MESPSLGAETSAPGVSFAKTRKNFLVFRWNNHLPVCLALKQNNKELARDALEKAERNATRALSVTWQKLGVSVLAISQLITMSRKAMQYHTRQHNEIPYNKVLSIALKQDSRYTFQQRGSALLTVLRRGRTRRRSLHTTLIRRRQILHFQRGSKS